MAEPVRTADPLHRSLGLTDEEHGRIVATLGREPARAELAMYAAMWSEHCSYKSSKVHLSELPAEGRHVLVGPGEDAGAVDLGDGMACVFKLESHSHPSAIEPYQGAATGVGGIVRDVLSMGARPVALLDALRFGPLDDELVADVIAHDQVVFRYADDNPNGALDDVAAVINRDGNVMGLMPHPEHAVDPDVGPVGGQPMLESLFAYAMAGAGS